MLGLRVCVEWGVHVGDKCALLWWRDKGSGSYGVTKALMISFVTNPDSHGYSQERERGVSLHFKG